METPDILVSVLVPAFNARATIDETLFSVRYQTYRKLEIIVVDDGSHDGTLEIAKRHAAMDSRVRLLMQRHAGVANARNRALSEASGMFVAPIDADDLWHPEKIEKQVLKMLECGPNICLVYTWYAWIDDESRIMNLLTPCNEGSVFTKLWAENFIGNASSPLIRRQAIVDAGGYDPSLLARNAQGCEDWKLYLQLAQTGEFGVVREVLTGYRHSRDSMSSDVLQMMRSYLLVGTDFKNEYLEHNDVFCNGWLVVTEYLLRRAIRESEYLSAFRALLFIFNESPYTCLRVVSALTKLVITRFRSKMFSSGTWNKELNTRSGSAPLPFAKLPRTSSGR
jgi:glycosyltransferase involved in cell wall biosynthesis